MPHLRVHVADLGLACCAVEFVAAVARGMLVPEPSGDRADSYAGADDAPSVAELGVDVPHRDSPPVNVLIVSGTVTHALTPAVVSAWEALAQPRAAIAFGACTISGGPYWDSYAVAAGIDAQIPVTRYVPGCPPRPEALVEALAAITSPELSSPELSSPELSSPEFSSPAAAPKPDPVVEGGG
jgi:NADH-quinone oxidoreductase subunit B